MKIINAQKIMTFKYIMNEWIKMGKPAEKKLLRRRRWCKKNKINEEKKVLKINTRWRR